MSGSPQRSFPRYAVDAAIEVRSGGEVAHGRTRNISRGGLCVELDRALSSGATAEVAIKLVFDDQGLSEALVLRCRVMWSTPFDRVHQIGVQFDGLVKRDVAYIDMFLRYLAQKADEAEEIREAAREDDPFA
jgi:hypothetical protein